jgi:exodeoxyribonuclease VII small subunit
MKELTFEEQLKALEAIVQKLEQGEVPLEESIAHYEEGMKLIEAAEAKLKAAQKVIAKKLDGDEEIDFDPEQNG